MNIGRELEDIAGQAANRISDLEEEVGNLTSTVESQDDEIETLRDEIQELKDRINDLEEPLGEECIPTIIDDTIKEHYEAY